MKFFKRMPNLHPNGFWVYLIKTFWNGSRIRLHYWPRRVKRLDTPHDHRSWFVSIPLWGRFVEKRFIETPGSDFDVVKCHSTTSGNGQLLTTPAGVGNVRLMSKHHRYPFIPYFCRLGTIHSLVPLGQRLAVTVVFFGPLMKTPRAWIKS